MNIIVRQARIIDPASSFHQQKADIVIENGFVTQIGNVTISGHKEIDIDGLCISPGWLDVFAHFCDPGFEHRETLETGTAAAAAGGYTDVMVLPNTAPVIHNKSGVEYLVQRSKSLTVNLHPIGAVTKNAEGKELSEMYDMHASGAVAFSDGLNSIQAAGIVLKALQYIKAIDKTLIQLPDSKSISANGLMNEGIVATQLGLPGNPSIAEELMVSRDIELVKYTSSKLHITGVSTVRSVALIAAAKQAGIAVTCSVTPQHLFFIDADVEGYDTNLKLTPPLRTAVDREALREGVRNGIIDCIASHHQPWDTDHKIVEFENAAFGVTSLQTSFAAVATCMPELSIERLVELFSSAPRKIFGLTQPKLAIGEPAAFTIFLPAQKWQLTKHYSRSGNTPFTGKHLSAKPLGIINGHGLFLNEQ